MNDVLANTLENTDYKTLSKESREYLIRSKDKDFIIKLNKALDFAVKYENKWENNYG